MYSARSIHLLCLSVTRTHATKHRQLGEKKRYLYRIDFACFAPDSPLIRVPTLLQPNILDGRENRSPPRRNLRRNSYLTAAGINSWMIARFTMLRHSFRIGLFRQVQQLAKIPLLPRLTRNVAVQCTWRRFASDTIRVGAKTLAIARQDVESEEAWSSRLLARGSSSSLTRACLRAVSLADFVTVHDRRKTKRGNRKFPRYVDGIFLPSVQRKTCSRLGSRVRCSDVLATRYQLSRLSDTVLTRNSSAFAKRVCKFWRDFNTSTRAKNDACQLISQLMVQRQPVERKLSTRRVCTEKLANVL